MWQRGPQSLGDVYVIRGRDDCGKAALVTGGCLRDRVARAVMTRRLPRRSGAWLRRRGDKAGAVGDDPPHSALTVRPGASWWPARVSKRKGRNGSIASRRTVRRYLRRPSMSKRSKSRQDELIRSMEGLAVLKETSESKPTKPKMPMSKIRVVAGLITGIIVASTALWWLLH